MSFSVRIAEGVADVALIAQMEKECFSMPWSEESIKSHMNMGAFFFIGECEGEPIGYAGMETVLDEANIYNIAVKKEYRRKGYGRALLQVLADTAKEKGVSTMYLEVRHRNLAAIGLYESFGFQFCGLRKNYYTSPCDNALLYRYSLVGEEFC